MEDTDEELGHAAELDSLKSDNTSEIGIENLFIEDSIDEFPPDEQNSEGQSEEREMEAHTTMGTVPLPVHKMVEMLDPGVYDTSSLTCPPRPPSVWGPFDPYNSSEDQDEEFVGVAALPNQVQWKSMKTGFEFTLMVVGESGLGKSTLINSLFLTDLYRDRTLYDARQRTYQTLAITKKAVDIVEKGVKLRLNLVDTPGFGDTLDDSNRSDTHPLPLNDYQTATAKANNLRLCSSEETKSPSTWMPWGWNPLAEYIDKQFEQFHRAELSLNRKNIQDNRVHCCLYFISPYGHGLRPIDVKVMKALHEKVNIVPVVAKADFFTPSEIQNMKARILNDLADNRIKVYQIPECDLEEDELFKKQYLELKRSMPFAVIGSNTVVEGKDKKFRARLYPWGVVDVENPAHCDFVHLRNMLVRTYMHHLKDITVNTHYENYRMQLLCRKH